MAVGVAAPPLSPLFLSLCFSIFFCIPIFLPGKHFHEFHQRLQATVFALPQHDRLSPDSPQSAFCGIIYTNIPSFSRSERLIAGECVRCLNPGKLFRNVTRKPHDRSSRCNTKDVVHAPSLYPRKHRIPASYACNTPKASTNRDRNKLRLENVYCN